MSILATPPAPPTLAQAAAEGVRLKNSEGIASLVACFREAFARVWHRADGVSAQQVFDQFGTSAGKLFEGAQATVQFIGAFAAVNGQTLADYLAPEDYTPPQAYTVGSDGTVTVTPPAPATPPAA